MVPRIYQARAPVIRQILRSAGCRVSCRPPRIGSLQLDAGRTHVSGSLVDFPGASTPRMKSISLLADSKDVALPETMCSTRPLS
jgi:hypothetical protein